MGRWLTGYQVKVTLRNVYVRAYIAPTCYSILFSIPQQRREDETRKAIRNIKAHFWNGFGAVNYPQMGAFKVESTPRHPAGLSFVRRLPPGGRHRRCPGKSSPGCLINRCTGNEKRQLANGSRRRQADSESIGGATTQNMMLEWMTDMVASILKGCTCIPLLSKWIQAFVINLFPQFVVL